MDAHAHLLSLGWAGPGHALDSRPYKQTGKRGLDYNPKQTTNTGVGLVKPLMISQRKERFGVGKKDPKHEPAAGNEWWLKGFETALNNIGKSESERSGTATPVMGQGTKNENWNEKKHAGLYGFFVKGQEMQGTIGEELLRRGRKRKSDRISGRTSDVDQEEIVNPKDGTEDFAQAAAFMTVRDRDETRRRKTEKACPMEEFEQATQFFEARSSRKEKKKNIPEVEPDSADGLNIVDVEIPVRDETKDERRARRRKRKEEKAKKAQAVLEGGDGDLPLSSTDDTSKRKHKDDHRRGKNKRGD